MRLRPLGLLITLALSLLAAPLVGEAQQAGKVPHVGIVFSGAPLSIMLGPNPSSTAMRELLQGLRDLGYIDGQNIILERRSAEGKYERFPDIMAEFIRLKVDVIVAGANPAAAAAKQATTTIPIVGVAIADPVEFGLVASLARPGGNITALSLFAAELTAKHLEIITEILPKVSRVAVLRYAPNPGHAALWRDAEIAGQGLGVKLQSVEVRDAGEFESAFSLMTKERAGALIILQEAVFFNEVRRLASLAIKHRLPAIFGFREFVDAGGLLSYGENIPHMFRRAAVFVDKMLKGVKPRDLPVERPTKLDLIINLKTARALGLTIPPSVLIRADQVIE